MNPIQRFVRTNTRRSGEGREREGEVEGVYGRDITVIALLMAWDQE